MKESLKQLCFDSKIVRSWYVWKMIESGILDNEIKKIKTGFVKTTMYSSFKKGIVSSEELFILNLDKFFMFLDFNLIIPNFEKFFIFKEIFKSKYIRFLNSPKDVNVEREWYIFMYKKTFIEKFFINVKQIKNYNITCVNTILNERLNLDNLSLKIKKDVDTLFVFLKDLINCSRHDVQLLFYDPILIMENKYLLDAFCSIFKNYKKRYSALKQMGL